MSAKNNFLAVIPEEVIIGHVFPFLKGNINDLLRFRRVSRYGKHLVDTYLKLRNIRSKAEVSVKLRHVVVMGRVAYESYERTRPLNWTGAGDTSVGGNLTKLIDLQDERIEGTLACLLKASQLYCLTRVYFNACCVSDLRYHSRMSEFVDRYRDQLTVMRLKVFALPLPQMGGFFGAFGNLQSLELDQFLIQGGAEFGLELPRNFVPNLKSLKINQFLMPGVVGEPHQDFLAMNQYYLKCCSVVELLVCRNQNLTFLSFPGLLHFRTKNRELQCRNSSYKFLETLVDVMKQPNGLKLVDLAMFYLQDPQLQQLLFFLEFGQLSQKHGVKWQNLDYSVARCMERFLEHLGPVRWLGFRTMLEECVVSLRNMHLTQWGLEMENLEQVRITRTSLCSMLPRALRGAGRPGWDKLKSFQMVVDSAALGRTQGQMSRGEPAAGVLDVMVYLFSERREALEEVKLKWTEDIQMVVPTSTVLLPRVPNIPGSCPNLKILALENWPGEENSVFLALWEALDNLEELYFGACKHLGINAFTRKRWSEPPLFSRQRKLKKVTFSHLDKMRGIGDNVLVEVLMEMQLRELHLRSDQPISQISLEGIECLEKGRIAASIERFPLSGGQLKIEGVTEGKLKELEEKFRSSQMI